MAKTVRRTPRGPDAARAQAEAPDAAAAVPPNVQEDKVARRKSMSDINSMPPAKLQELLKMEKIMSANAQTQDPDDEDEEQAFPLVMLHPFGSFRSFWDMWTLSAEPRRKGELCGDAAGRTTRERPRRDAAAARKFAFFGSRRRRRARGRAAAASPAWI